MAYKEIYLAGLLLLFTSIVSGQSQAEKSFRQVATLDEAQRFIDSFPSRKPMLHILNSQNDTSALDQQLYKKKIGDITKIGSSSYKIIEDTVKYAFRASYIYLDGSRLSQQTIDSIRSLIQKRYSAGVSFEDLADEYTMDGNQNHGDIGLFFTPGMMVKEFEDGVRGHAKGDIFTVDVPGNQWYYVVKKTADDRVTIVMTVLEIK